MLEPFVPAGTVLDAWEGRTTVSLVGFRFLRTRLLGVPIPGHVNFLEVNLRFYVRRPGGSEEKRGIVFLSEIVPRRAIVWVARRCYNEPYRALPMRHRIQRREDGWPETLAYEWRREGRWEGLSLGNVGTNAPTQPGSEAAFLVGRSFGYTRQRDGSTIEYAVEHPPWQVREMLEGRFTGDAMALYGLPFARILEGPPRSILLADGSPVRVTRPRRL